MCDQGSQTTTKTSELACQRASQGHLTLILSNSFMKLKGLLFPLNRWMQAARVLMPEGHYSSSITVFLF